MEILELEQKLTGDFIPNGEMVDKVFNIFKIPDLKHPLDQYLDIFYPQAQLVQIMRCCFQIGDDIQSGPIYCGNFATHFSIVNNNAALAACPRHLKILQRMYVEPFGK